MLSPMECAPSDQNDQDFVFVDEVQSEPESEPDDLEVDGETIEKIQKWLNHTDYLNASSEYQKHLRPHITGTNLWTQDTDSFRKWHDSPSHGSLWIKATAGTGKSVFAAVTASRLAQEENVPVLFFFFRQIIATNHDPNYLTRDFISQLLPYSQTLQRRMRRLIDNGRSSESVPTSEFWSHLLNSLDLLSKVYCVIDGLDEMDMAGESFLDSLIELGKRRPSSIKVLMTSRPLPWIEAHLKNPSVVQLRLNPDMVDRDISTYVEHRLSHRSDLSDDIKVAFRRSMESKAKGSFLYSRLMMDELMEHLRNMVPDIAYIQRPLSWLPQSLEEMYDGMLFDHSLRSHVSQELQVAILRCVTHSIRPLRLIELATMLHHILSHDSNITCHQNFSRYQSTTVLKERKLLIRNACGPLLEILPDETISIIHHSFTEYLTDTERLRKSSSVHPQFPVILPKPTHYGLAYACLKYMECLDDWHLRPFTIKSPRHEHDDILQIHDFNIRFPFIEYAMKNWHIHLRALEVENHEYIEGPAFQTGKSEVFESLNSFFHSNGQHRYLAWIDLTWSRHREMIGRRAYLEFIEPLHVAAACGLTSYARHLLACGAELKNTSRRAQQLTPLMLASENGFLDMVEILIAHDPQVNRGDDLLGFKPLHYATQSNHPLVVKRLLVAGANPLVTVNGRINRMLEGARNATPLYLACTSDAVDSLIEMIPYIPPEKLISALHYAIERNKGAAVEALLSSPYVDPNGDDETPAHRPLHHAIRRRLPLIVNILLAKGADPNQRTKLMFTPLHALAQQTHTRLATEMEHANWKSCFHQLINAGADINSTTKDGETALHFAVAIRDQRFSYELAELLLEKGADPNVRDEKGNTVLHKLRIHSDESHMINLLTNYQVDISARRNNDGKTPLHSIITNSYEGNLQPILHHIRDCQTKDSQGNTVLHLVLLKLTKAISNDRVQSCATMVTDLLEAGCDPTERNDDGLTPLLLLFSHQNTVPSSSNRPRSDYFYDTIQRRIIPALLKHGDSLETTDYDGRTILLRTLTNHKLAYGILIPMLLDMGAAKDARDYEGNTILHLHCKMGGSIALFDYLADKGVDFFAVNHAGNTLLHEIGSAFQFKHPFAVPSWKWFICYRAKQYEANSAAYDMRNKTE
jgi:ankyrin repeat protein